MKTIKHCLSSEKKQEFIQQIGSFLEKELPELLAAYIFGSFVSQKPFADIDVALLLESAADEPLKLELLTENKIEQILHLPIDIRVMNNAPLAFQYQVFRDGKLIVDPNPNKRAEYEGQVLKQYFEISRFRKRYLKEVMHAPL